MALVGGRGARCWCVTLLLALAGAVPVFAQSVPEVPASVAPALAGALANDRAALIVRIDAHNARIDAFNARCGKVADDACRKDMPRLIAEGTALEADKQAFDARIDAVAFTYLYALQTRTLTPIADGGHPIDAPGMPTVGLHGLVGGTSWTYGFQRPLVKCEAACQAEMKTKLASQLTLFCSSQKDPQTCVADGLPFTPGMYDMVVSMGSSHSAVEDLATRVLFDGASFGEFSRANKEIFASLKGRDFDTQDCHSNGAMLCLAALRSGDTQAKEVRLFGPQMTPEAAKRWQEYAASSHTTIKIFINNGDPIPALSWKQPVPQTPVAKAATAVWLTNPVTGPAAFADALFNTYFDSKTATMDTTFKSYGFAVTRSTCQASPNIDCHSMKRYESHLQDARKP